MNSIDQEGLRERIAELLWQNRLLALEEAGNGEPQLESIAKEQEFIQQGGGIAPPETAPKVELSDLEAVSNPGQFTHETYRRVLGRDPDLDGFVLYRDLLACGASKQAVVAIIATSPEARARSQQFLWHGAPLGPPSPLRWWTHVRMRFRRYRKPRPSDVIEQKLYTLVDSQTRLQRKQEERTKSDATTVDVFFSQVRSWFESISARSERTEKVLLALTDGQHRLHEEQEAGAKRELAAMELLSSQARVGFESAKLRSEGIEKALSTLVDGQRQMRKERDEHENRVTAVVEQWSSRVQPTFRLLETRSVSLEQSLSAVRDDLIRLEKEQQERVKHFDAALELWSFEVKSAFESTAARMEMLQALTRRLTEKAEEIAMLARPPVLTGPDVLVARLDDFVVAIPREDWRMAAYYAFWGSVDVGLTLRLKELLKPGMVFVDVGANIGFHTLHAARSVGPLGRVYSFEPAPRTFAVLRQNVEANGINWVDLRQVGILDKETRVPLHIDNYNSALNTLFPENLNAPSEIVHVTDLDSALSGVGRLDVVKIDAEGAEPLILRGMKGLFESNPDLTTIIEFAPAHIARAGVQPAEFLDHLNAHFVVNIIEEHSGELLSADRELLSTASANLQLKRISKA